MAGSIINNLGKEATVCEREYQYWMQRAEALNAEADKESDAAKAHELRKEASMCEYFAEDSFSTLDCLRTLTRMAEESL